MPKESMKFNSIFEFMKPTLNILINSHLKLFMKSIKFITCLIIVIFLSPNTKAQNSQFFVKIKQLNTRSDLKINF